MKLSLFIPGFDFAGAAHVKHFPSVPPKLDEMINPIVSERSAVEPLDSY